MNSLHKWVTSMSPSKLGIKNTKIPNMWTSNTWDDWFKSSILITDTIPKPILRWTPTNVIHISSVINNLKWIVFSSKVFVMSSDKARARVCGTVKPARLILYVKRYGQPSWSNMSMCDRWMKAIISFFVIYVRKCIAIFTNCN